jgi:hypothetical protein
MFYLNIEGVVIAAVVAFILGFLFHGPVSGKLWMRLADIHPTGNEKFKDMVPQMLWNLLANLFTAYGLSVVYVFATSSPYVMPGIRGGMGCGLLVWLTFLVTSSSIEVIWMKRKTSLWIFESVCSLIVMLAMGAIIANF